VRRLRLQPLDRVQDHPGPRLGAGHVASSCSARASASRMTSSPVALYQEQGSLPNVAVGDHQNI
jgi:hypothetical protein